MSLEVGRCCRSRTTALRLALGCTAALPAPVLAQGAIDAVPADVAGIPQSVRAPQSIHWWHGALFVGGVSTLMLLDNAVKSGSQDLRSGTTDGFASGIRRFGQPEVYATTTLGLLAAGLVTGNPKLTGAGKRVAASLAIAGGTMGLSKAFFGRARPDDPFQDGDDFGLFDGRGSLPSGHTAMAFAFATSLSDEIRNPWVSAGLYTAAGAVGWSRINDDRHWLSDVAAGAVLGIASAKFASGRWTIFGLRAPTLITGPRGMGIGWQAQF